MVQVISSYTMATFWIPSGPCNQLDAMVRLFFGEHKLSLGFSSLGIISVNREISEVQVSTFLRTLTPPCLLSQFGKLLRGHQSLCSDLLWSKYIKKWLLFQSQSFQWPFFCLERYHQFQKCYNSRCLLKTRRWSFDQPLEGSLESQLSGHISKLKKSINGDHWNNVAELRSEDGTDQNFELHWI